MKIGQNFTKNLLVLSENCLLIHNCILPLWCGNNPTFPGNSVFIFILSAKFADDLSGSIYKHIIAHRGTYHTQMSASGPATGTGKSLMQTMMMYIFYGEMQPSTTSLTEASFYAKLEEGDIFGKPIIFTDIANDNNAIF